MKPTILELEQDDEYDNYVIVFVGTEIASKYSHGEYLRVVPVDEEVAFLKTLLTTNLKKYNHYLYEKIEKRIKALEGENETKTENNI